MNNRMNIIGNLIHIKMNFKETNSSLPGAKYDQVVFVLDEIENIDKIGQTTKQLKLYSLQDKENVFINLFKENLEQLKNTKKTVQENITSMGHVIVTEIDMIEINC